MARHINRRGFLGALASAPVLTALPAWAASKQQELVDKARYTVESFTGDPDMRWLRENIGRAKGVLIVPTLGKAGFIVGGSGGSGVLLAHDLKGGSWSYPAFYTMGSVTFGLQIGGEVAEVILAIMTQRGMDAMLTTEFKLGGDVSVTAGPIGAGAKAQTADILAFSRSKGLYGGLNLEGAVIATRAEWNQKYYGRAVRPVEILIERKVSNAGANALRAAVARTIS